MVLLARDLRATGEVRPDLSDQQVADFVWSTNSAEYFELLTQRGWSAQQFRGPRDRLVDADVARTPVLTRRARLRPGGPQGRRRRS